MRRHERPLRLVGNRLRRAKQREVRLPVGISRFLLFVAAFLCVGPVLVTFHITFVRFPLLLSQLDLAVGSLLIDVANNADYSSDNRCQDGHGDRNQSRHVNSSSIALQRSPELAPDDRIGTPTW